MNKLPKIFFFLLIIFATNPAHAEEKSNASKTAWPDLVAVKGGTPAQMFEVGIKAYGGLDRFIKKGQTVLIKPNIGWDKTADEGGNTSPDLVARIVKMAYEVGAIKVYVFDYPVNRVEDCYKNSGIETAIEAQKGIMFVGHEESDFREVKIDRAKVLKTVKVHKLYLDSDVVINVPVLKNHGSTNMTAALKNLMGVVFDRMFWHKNGLHETIAEFPFVRKPDLNVVDAYKVMMRRGPRGVSKGDLELKKMLLISKDMVLIDTAAAKIIGQNPDELQYLKLARDFGHGSMDLGRSEIKRISL